MSATIISGKIARESLASKLKEKIGSLSHVPKLVIIQVGSRPDSTAYIQAKLSFAKEIGVDVERVNFLENISQAEVIEQIKKYNTDVTIQGIIIQLPLPLSLDRDATIEAIDPKKDVDGLTTTNYDKLIKGDSTAIIPATARGVKELLDFYSIELKGKKVAVVGRSRLVGTPIAVLCKNAGADVIVCHSKTLDLAQETKQADIVIVAVGKPGLISGNHIKNGAIVIDVGISKNAEGVLKGDVDFEKVKEIASMITPVPGGVGPMTVLGLFENVVGACS